MRGRQERTGSLFSYVSVEDRIPASHPLRRIRKLADQALDRLNPTFCALYASEGRPSVPPEQLLLASLLQAFYGIRSERLLLEQLHYNLLFRCYGFAGPAATWVSARMIRSGIRQRSPRTASGCSTRR
jgi:transposase